MSFWPFEIPRGGFPCVSADPPWSYKAYSTQVSSRAAGAHYKTMTEHEILSLPVQEAVAKDCHLFLWVTGPFLSAGLHLPVMRAWGFKPSTDVFVWLKTKISVLNSVSCVNENLFVKGLGKTTRKNAEYVVLGRRGSPKRKSASIHQLILAPRREHSRKPEEFFERVEEYCDGPYLELFSRESRPGWESWGNEATKFDVVTE